MTTLNDHLEASLDKALNELGATDWNQVHAPARPADAPPAARAQPDPALEVQPTKSPLAEARDEFLFWVGLLIIAGGVTLYLANT